MDIPDRHNRQSDKQTSKRTCLCVCLSFCVIDGVLHIGAVQIFIGDDAAAAADDDDDNELGLVWWINTELYLLCHLITAAVAL